MVLDEDEQEQANSTNNPRARNAIRKLKMRWPGNSIPYVIGIEFTKRDRAIIMKAMNIYKEYTCLRFKPRTNEQGYIYITKGSGCHSRVGYQGRRQDVSLGQGCMYPGIVIHEFMHAIGNN